MSNKTFFTPGPSQLYPGVDQFLQDAVEADVCSISHRSAAFKEIFEHTIDSLRTLLGLPDNFQIMFTGSATEIWERIIANCTESNSFHFVNGSFSKKFFQYSKESIRNAQMVEAPFGEGFNVDNIKFPKELELICVTQNETSSGVQFPVEDIKKIHQVDKEALIAVDVVSSLPIPKFDYSTVDTLFFSVQKCFGLPAGLGVWIANERCIDSANLIKSRGNKIGPHHELPQLAEMAADNQTPATPNVLGIYLLGRVCDSMLEKGIDTIRKETAEKKALLYDCIETCDYLSHAVVEPKHRSDTVVVINSTISAAELNKKLASLNFVIGSGYGKYKETQLRIANFPAISVEKTKELVEALKKIN